MSLIRQSSFVFVALGASAVQAQVFNESTDVGNMPGTAQVVTTTTNNLTINGSFFNVLDTDMYRITIGSAANFSATVTSSGDGIEDDTLLFLFQLNGQGIAFNDDISSNNFLSALPVGNALYSSLAAGDYLLAIAPYDIHARINTGTGTSFANYVFEPSGLSNATQVRGPRTSEVIAGWDTDPSLQFGTTGTYQIQITGLQAVPEPTTMVALGVGALALMRRRKK